jgi:hypothetical protein
MDKKNLQEILSQPFVLSDWRQILTMVFGAKQLLTQPKPILLKNNEKAKSATELGSFATYDDRIIGLYHVVVNDDIWLEKNKVGLRELLRNIYRYDVDGALVVFEQGDKWRLSFISEIKVLNDEGEIIKQATEPKRYTYLLGLNEKVKTPSERLSKLAGKTLALNDILNAFSVEALNEEFYKIISEYFYQLVGGTVGAGKATKTFEPKLKLPTSIENHQIYQEFVVRLIGRTIFCWFLKMKKSDEGVSLVPEGLLSSVAVKSNKGYYHHILERLFFQTLNTKMEERVDGLPKGCEKTPFLNGGLFEPNYDDYYKPNRITGINENLNTLVIEDDWFFKLFIELEKYNFTIDENSVTDVEVSVDPEMLGRIFENLLAEIDPDSGETARKATGSFYTPREIVDYMATESLVQYIHNKTSIAQEKIRPVFKMTEVPDPTFTKNELEGILDALDKVKILDPACGSGAFPMGVLQKIVQALQKLDANAEWWKKRQIERISNPIVRKVLKQKLDASGVEYARKIGVIQNSLYGVDIQPIAAEISKLRCFLTLIVDENIDETKPNRGIEPLPNLEFKFVTADTLQKLPKEKDFGGLFNNNNDLDQLAVIRQEYLQSYGEQKLELKKQFKATQDKIAKQQLGFGAALDVNSRAWLISTWNPFSHDKADWFDPQWMFGIEKFDVVIGNPPYGATIDNKTQMDVYYPDTSFGGKESYKYFFNASIGFISNGGILAFITSDSFIEKESFTDLRQLILKETKSSNIIRLGDNIFNNVNLPTAISILNIARNKENGVVFYFGVASDSSITQKINKLINTRGEHVEVHKDIKIRFCEVETLQINVPTKPLIDLYDQVMGVKVYQVGKGKPKQSSHEISVDLFVSEKKQSDEWVKFIDSGVKRYEIEEYEKYIKYGEWLAEPRKAKYFLNPKIILREVINPVPFATYFEKEAVVKNTNAVIIKKDNEFSLLLLLAILNSDIFNFYLKKESPKSNNKSFPSITSKLLKAFPIPITKNAKSSSFKIVSNYLLFIKTIDVSKNINNVVSNQYLFELFDSVVKALVMELYFEADFKKAGIEFIKYAERDFESIEGKSVPEQIEIINKAYQKLSEKDNEIRNNLKLMDIKLTDIVMPIKTAK